MDDWDKVAEEVAALNRASSESVDPALAAKRLEEAHALAVREGWSDAEGNSLLPQDNDVCSECGGDAIGSDDGVCSMCRNWLAGREP